MRGQRTAAITATMALALIGTGIGLPLAAVANPADAATTSTFDNVGPFGDVLVPDGVCAVTATVTGGAGGSAVSTAPDANGAAAQITATYPVVPGLEISGTVGGGGGTPSGNGSGSSPGVGGANGGGTGGFSGPASGVQHHGAGGGGYSSLTLGEDLAILAGGGGGSGGGHSVGTDGAGGDAGLPELADVVAVGSDGNDGLDVDESVIVSGGEGGQLTAAGAGGENSSEPSADGVSGDERNGGAGGVDANPDAGGGGGAGFYGGGGGASTEGYNSQDGSQFVSGAGGGGGGSFVAGTITLGEGTASMSGLASEAFGKRTGTGSGPGVDGSVELDWVECAYDLAVTKSSDAVDGEAKAGDTVTWTVAVINNGPDAMTKGDTVTLVDTLPGDGVKTITGISTAGGSSDLFVSGAVTCNVAVAVDDDPPTDMPGTLVCSRPYQPIGGTAAGVRGLDNGETLTITYTQSVVVADENEDLDNTATVEDRTEDDTNDQDISTVSVVVPPNADDDEKEELTVGEPVEFDVLDNDEDGSGAIDPDSLTFCDVGGGSLPASYEVTGEGTWTIVDGTVTFTPVTGFEGDPTPVNYCITDSNGLKDSATITADYEQFAADDEDLGNTIGDPVVVDVLGNDVGDFDGSSVVIVDPETDNPVEFLDVEGEGRWTVGTAGDITFTPEEGFLGDPESIKYRVDHSDGDDPETADVTVTYVPVANSDEDLENTIGDPVTINVLNNDTGVFNDTTVVIKDGSSWEDELIVANEGTWAVGTAGNITFTPLEGFLGDPAPIDYQVTDTTGDPVSATVTVEYQPAATDDESHGHTIGDAVEVDVLGNDVGDFDESSIAIVDPESNDPVDLLEVDGEGTWTTDPATGALTFTPEDGYRGNPTPVDYRITDSTGDTVSAEVLITYLPEATNDIDSGNVRGTAVTVDVVGNDNGVFDPASVVLVHPTSGLLLKTLAIGGEGAWTVNAVTGAITFTPESGFTGNPTPVEYQVTDLAGITTFAEVVITYLPAALQTTGADFGPPLIAGTLLLVLGGGALVYARRKHALI